MPVEVSQFEAKVTGVRRWSRMVKQFDSHRKEPRTQVRLTEKTVKAYVTLAEGDSIQAFAETPAAEEEKK